VSVIRLVAPLGVILAELNVIQSSWALGHKHGGLGALTGTLEGSSLSSSYVYELSQTSSSSSEVLSFFRASVLLNGTLY